LIRIIVYGSGQSKLISQKIALALSGFGCVEYMSDNFIKTNGESFDFLICDTETLNCTDYENTIFILKNSFKINPPPSLTKNSTVIFDGTNMRAAAYVKSCYCRTLDCGTSTHNTISIAGLNTDRAAVSIQRTVITLKGEKIEPMDITIKLKEPLPPYITSAITASLLICGIPYDDGYCF